MDQSDARWGSLRETARRFLRTEGVRLGVPVHDRFSALKLVERIAEKIPEEASNYRKLLRDFTRRKDCFNWVVRPQTKSYVGYLEITCGMILYQPVMNYLRPDTPLPRLWWNGRFTNLERG